MNKRTLRDIEVEGRRVLLRTDYNVDVVGGRVIDDLRIEASLPTIRALLDGGARVVICSHRGRPRGRVDPALSNAPVAAHLAELLRQDVGSAADCIGTEVEREAEALQPGGVLMLENLRFHSEEEANDDGFARSLARLGDVFVNDAFGVLHRAHASLVGVPRHLPSAAGLLVEREVARLSEIDHARPPLALVLGGAKIADKLPLVRHLLPRLQFVCLGGAAAVAVLQAARLAAPAGVEDDALRAAVELLQELRDRPEVRLMLPCDLVATDGATSLIVSPLQVPEGWRVVDIGPSTLAAFGRTLGQAATIVWNGPMGVFEQPPFDHGTNWMAEYLAECGAQVVVAGASTVQAARGSGRAHAFWHVSTGGGAALQLLSGTPLPGLEALPDV